MTRQSSPTPDGATIALALDRATVTAGARAILDDVSLNVAAGERVALIGPSGAGKTTLLRLLGASLWPSSGEVRVLGEDASRLGGRALRRHRRRVGFLRQRENLIPALRVAHNVLMGRLGHWSSLRAAWNLVFPGELERARRALSQVELEDRLWALPDDLSGGERQRVAIARLIVQEPDVVLADEPVSALDVRLGEEVIRLLVELADRKSATLVVSLHNLGLVSHGFDRVVALNEGRIRWEGAPRELDAATLRDVYGTEYAELGPFGAQTT